jgi:prephenate dehydrogenase
LKDLKKISVIGLGLLGGSITLTVLRSLPGIKIVGHTHRPATRKKAKRLAVAAEIVGDMKTAVCNANLVIIATPIYTFEEIFKTISDSLPAGCIITDVGSTKVLPHRWAAKRLRKNVHYIGSHPIAGSEQRGIEFARDDLFDQAMCVLTATSKTNRRALKTLKNFWSALGCSVKIMTPAQHDKVLANVSHVPHMVAASLINANSDETLQFAGRGFIDTSRIASGPANIWADILLTNPENSARGIDRVIKELTKLRKAIKGGDRKQTENLLKKAREKRATLIKYKIRKKEMIS